MVAWLALAACSSQGRATQTPAAPTRTPLPTAVIYVDQNRQPVWPTPPGSCATSPQRSERPDLGPTLGESPIWIASKALPVIPWRNELVPTIWVVDRSAAGDLALSGRQTDGSGAIRFIRAGGEHASEQLVVPSAASVGALSTAPTAARYADVQVYLSIPQPGCYALQARLGETTQTLTIYAYN